MKIEEEKSIIHLDIVWEINKPMLVKAFALKEIEIKIDGVKFNIIESHRESGGYRLLAMQNVVMKKKDTYSFFAPDYIVDANNQLIEMRSETFGCYEWNLENLVDFKMINKDFNLNVSFEVAWRFNDSKIVKYQNSMSTTFFEKLKDALPCSGSDYNNLRVFNVSCDNAEVEWKKESDYKHYCVTKFDFSMLYEYYFDVYMKQALNFVFKKNDSYKFKNLKFKLILPSNDECDVWSAGRIYFENDVVLHNDEFYKCLKDNNDEVFKIENFEKVDSIKEPSFGKIDSFFHSSYGQEQIENLKKHMQFLVEKHIAARVQLTLLNVNMPFLNQSFLYNDNLFRIVKIHYRILDNKKYCTIFGIQILKEIEFSQFAKYCEDDYVQAGYVSYLIWDFEEKSYCEPSVSMCSFFEHCVFEGLRMQLPKNLKKNQKIEVLVNV